MVSNNFFLDLTSVLRKFNVSEEDIDFIKSLIREDDRDSNLLIMNDDVYTRLEEKGLKGVFDKACQKLGFKWTYSNEPNV